jgi:hypothetical protein
MGPSEEKKERKKGLPPSKRKEPKGTKFKGPKKGKGKEKKEISSDEKIKEGDSRKTFKSISTSSPHPYRSNSWTKIRRKKMTKGEL